PKPALTFMGVNPMTRQWQRQTTYGGSVCENLVQGIARDLLASALLRLEASNEFRPILSVHDEILAEGPIDAHLSWFNTLMEATPPWAEGCPVAAESWKGNRYRK